MRVPHRVDDPDDKCARVDPRLVRLLEAALRFLPPGWRLAAGASAGPLAIDVQLIDPRGRPLPNKTRDQAGGLWREYRKLADLVYHCQRVRYPELEGRLAWGGKFASAAGEWEIGRFDLGGWRGRGRYRAPEPDRVPESIAAALRSPDDGDAAFRESKVDGSPRGSR